MKLNNLTASLLLFLFSSLIVTVNAQSRIYVDQNASGTNDGSSWEHAYSSLAEALYQAGTGDTVWVAEGVYKPERTRDGSLDPSNFLATFKMPNHVKLYGGFIGTETADTQRDWRANPCILSGDIGAIGSRGDNCCHVIFNPDTAMVDGFIIQDGNGENHTADYDFGAGVYNDGKLIIRNCIIRNNRCRYGGGMFCNNDSYLEMHRCLVYNNEAFQDSHGGSGYGGGISLQHIGYAMINHSSIWGNLQNNHQGVYTYGATSANIENSIVWNNSVYNSDMQYSCIQDSSGVNIIDEDPLFTDPEGVDFSLQRGSPCINAADPANPADPDGTRADIGMEIYEHDTIDLGIMAFNHWDGGFMTGQQDVTVTLKSFGTETITTADIGWEVDGVVQTLFSWTGNLSLYEKEDSIVIGSFDFSHKYHTLEAWVMDPNGKTDEYPENDTLEATKFACDSMLNNSYVLGAGGTYTTFNKALDALCNCGISGTTTFLVEDGVYNEQVRIPEIEGTGATDTIVFCSQSGDSSQVILTYTPLDQSKPYTLRLDSADYITIQGMTLASRDSAWGHTIQIGNGARHNNFLNNIIEGDTLTDHLFFSESADSTVYDLLISNNHFRRGKWSLNLVGGNSENRKMTGVRIEHNLMDDFSIGAINLEWIFAPQIKNNLIRCTFTEYQFTSLISCSSIQGQAVISCNNLIKTHMAGGANGIRFNASSSSPGNEMLIFNNFISINNAATCFTAYSSGNMKIYNNTFLTYGSGGTPLHLGDSDYQIYNNNFVNLSGGYAANYSYSPPPICDYNNYFTTGDVLIKNGSFEAGSLQEWIDGSGEDQYSVSSISGFFGLTDLHTFSADLDSAGTPLPEVTTDIDGEARNVTHPDIGADEFDYPGAFHGDFIIGSSDTAQFKSVLGALNLMNMLHIDGTVNFCLEPGDYEEQLIFFPIPGASAEHPVTFSSLSGDSSDTRISYHYQTFQNNYVFHLKGARHLHFKNLGFRTDNINHYQGLILLTDSCVDVSFTGNSFFAPERSYSTHNDLVSSTGYRNTELVFTGNHFLNGGRGISIRDKSYTDYHRPVKIISNLFINQSDASIFTERVEELLIYSNRIYSLPDYAGGGGSGHGIHLRSTYKGDLYSPHVANNIIHLQSPASGNAFHLIGSDSLMILHNTVLSSGTLLFTQSCSGITANNILHSRTGTSVVSVDDTAKFELVHNTYYIDDLDWGMAYPLMDSTSVEADPKYRDLTGFSPTSPFLNNTGRYFAEVHYDINGVSRYPDPDMGAVEFDDAIYNVPFNDTSACFGSTIMLDAGEGYDSYAWSNDSTEQTFTLVPGLFIPGNRDFYISVNFRGNEYKDTVRVWLSMPVVDLGPDISNCADDTAHLDAGPGFIWYDWSYGSGMDGQQIFSPPIDIYNDHSYSVTVTDTFGCNASDTVLVHYKKLPGFVIISLASDSTLESNVSDDVFEYQWYRNGEIIPGAISNVCLMTVGGSYSLEGITAEGCSMMSEAYVSTVSVNPIQGSSGDFFTLYPNPGRSKVFLEFTRTMGESELTIVDINGRMILQKRLSGLFAGDLIELDISGMPRGVYNIRLISGSGTVNKILIVQ